jgi:Transposase DDE domain
VLDMIQWPAGAIVVVDRSYLDFTRLHSLHQRQVSFVIRAKDNTRYTRVASREVDKSTGLRSDQTILLTIPKSKLAYPDRLRRISYRDSETSQFLIFLTNRFDLPAFTIAEIYRQRWAVETFFKWIKQNLSIKHFFGNSINAVKSQIWIAVCVYLIIIIARKRLNLPASPQLLLNIIEVNMFEKIQIDKLVFDALMHFPDDHIDNQMILL